MLGVSKGLGREFAKLYWEKFNQEVQLLLVSRKTNLLEGLKNELIQATNSESSTDIQVFSSDFSDLNHQIGVINFLKAYKANELFYFAGGGPYGKFDKKEWKDHQWAFEVSFLFPAKLIHWSLQHNVDHFTVVGSAICESNPDPLSSSYCAAKHGLRGLVSSLNLENHKLKISLVSPPYLDTDLLPKNAHVRQFGDIISPKDYAKKMINDIVT